MREKPEGEGSNHLIIPMLPWYNYFLPFRVQTGFQELKRRDDILSRGNLVGKLALLSHGYFHSNYGLNIYIYIYGVYTKISMNVQQYIFSLSIAW